MKENNFNELKQEDIVHYLKENIRSSFNDVEFNWEFKSLTDNIVFKLYTDNKKIIASQAMLPVKLIINNLEVLTAKSETSYLNKDYRGNNHFEELYFSAIKDSQNKGFEIIWGFTPAVKVWKTKLNFDVVKPNISEATLNISKYPSNLFLEKYTTNKIIFLAKLTLYSFLRVFEKKNKRPLNQISKTTSSSFPDDLVLQEFQKKISEKFNINVYVDLNKEYLNWRVKTNPLLKYQSYFFYEKSILLGYVIFSITDDRLSIANISFLDSSFGSYILDYLLNIHSSNINSIFYFGNDDSEYGKCVFNVFNEYKAKIIKSNWANTVIKDVSLEGKHKNNLDTSRWLINGLWTEGFSI